MNKQLEKLAIDLIKFNKIDERSNHNKGKDMFMVMCFKIFIIAMVLTILYLLTGKCIRKVKME